MRHPDISILVVGLLRPVFWIGGAYLSILYRNWFAFIGCVLCILVSIPGAFIYAGYEVSHTLINLTSILATPAVMFIVAGIAYSAKNTLHMLRRIEEWEDRFQP